TEIRTEKQKPVWPWALALIAFGVIIYLFFFRGDGNMNAEKKADPPGNEVTAYFQLVDDDTDTVGLSPEYTSEAMRKLTVAAKYPDLLKEANSLKAATVAIRADTLISEQPMEIKNFFRLAKDLLQKMYGQSP